MAPLLVYVLERLRLYTRRVEALFRRGVLAMFGESGETGDL